jgi:putative phosphoribosyl transferase
MTTYQQESFTDRQHAAEMLLRHLGGRVSTLNPLILGIPCGGLMLAGMVARSLGADLDVILTGKIGAPRNPELAVGAVFEDGHVYLQDEYVAALGISRRYIEKCRETLTRQMERQKRLYRSVRARIPLAGKTVILIDDGAAAEATIQAAIWSSEREKPDRLILALPAAPPETLRKLSTDVTEVICVCPANDADGNAPACARFEDVKEEDAVCLLKEYVSSGNTDEYQRNYHHRLDDKRK